MAKKTERRGADRLTLKALASQIAEMARERRADVAMVDLVRRGRIAEIEQRDEAMALILRLEARVARLEAERLQQAPVVRPHQGACSCPLCVPNKSYARLPGMGEGRIA